MLAEVLKTYLEGETLIKEYAQTLLSISPIKYHLHTLNSKEKKIEMTRS